MGLMRPVTLNTMENKLILEFLNTNVNNDGTYELPQFGTIRPNGEFKTSFTLEQMKFNKDWNWLMQVVDKIEFLDNGKFDVNLLKNGTQIFEYQAGGKVIVNNVGEISFNNKIEHVYQAVVEFIIKLTSMKAIVTEIQYDTDGEVVTLPTQLEIDIPSYIEDDDVDDFVSDEISNITGYCHFGFSFKLVN